MNVKTSSKNKNRIKRNFLIYLTCVNSIFISLIFIATLKLEVNTAKFLIVVCLMLLYVNIRLTLSYFKSVRSLDPIKTYDDLDKSNRKKYIMVILLSLAGTVLGGFLLFVKGMEWIGVGILIVDVCTFSYFHKKLLKNSGGNIPPASRA